MAAMIARKSIFARQTIFNMKITMSIAHLIRAGRTANAMTEQGFADAIGVTRSAVQQWESGRTAPARKHQAAVAELIGISLGELMSGQSARYPINTAEPPPQQIPRRTDSATAYAQEQATQLLALLSTQEQQEAISFMRFLVARGGAKSSQQSAGGESGSISSQKAAA